MEVRTPSEYDVVFATFLVSRHSGQIKQLDTNLRDKIKRQVEVFSMEQDNLGSAIIASLLVPSGVPTHLVGNLDSRAG
jgi:hypothetical protein